MAGEGEARSFHGDVRLGIRADREGDETRLGASLEHHEPRGAAGDACPVLAGPRRSHPQLAVAQAALEAQGDPMGRRAAILHGDRVHGPGEVGVAAVRREDRPAQHQVGEGTGEGRQPRGGALPRHGPRGEILHRTVDLDAWPEERRTRAVDEVGVARELDRRPRPAMQQSHGVDGAVGRMDARQGKPMVPGELPGNGGKGVIGHGGSAE
jgi:hypothetical protein